MKPIHAKSEFQQLEESSVAQALEDSNPANPIAVEVARLVEGYTQNFAEHVKNLGEIPESILRSKGTCPIEEIAMRLVAEAIRKTIEGEDK